MQKAHAAVEGRFQGKKTTKKNDILGGKLECNNMITPRGGALGGK